VDEKEDKVMQLLDDLKEEYGQFLDGTASEAGDGSGLHFDLTSGNIVNGDEIYVEAFYLKPEAQGKGIGKKMVNAMKKLSDEINVPITLLDKTLESPYGTSFWKSMGFDIDDDTTSGFYNYEGDPSSSRFAR
jgi:GNAT superfamily N-acetyltransferase